MNATNPEPAAVARREALDKRLGYKIKDLRNHDLAIFRWSDKQGGWLDLKRPAVFATDDANVLTALAWAEDSRRAHVSVFACCCAECHTEDAQTFQRTIANAGGSISHGYWPECMKAELKRHGLTDDDAQAVGDSETTA